LSVSVYFNVPFLFQAKLDFTPPEEPVTKPTNTTPEAGDPPTPVPQKQAGDPPTPVPQKPEVSVLCRRFWLTMVSLLHPPFSAVFTKKGEKSQS
jgi:hypothetical protein